MFKAFVKISGGRKFYPFSFMHAQRGLSYHLLYKYHLPAELNFELNISAMVP